MSAVPTGAETDPVGVWPLRPAPPQVVAGFDPPDSAWGSGHRGVDLLGHPGQEVHAALAGTISYTGILAGRGVVVVDHGDTRTTYEPVTASVSRGDVVSAGAVIGTLQLIGSHCLPRACLHLGWLRGEDYLDPLRLVGGGPVRLLPLAGLPSASTVAALRTGTHRSRPTPDGGPASPTGQRGPARTQARGCACW